MKRVKWDKMKVKDYCSIDWKFEDKNMKEETLMNSKEMENEYGVRYMKL